MVINSAQVQVVTHMICCMNILNGPHLVSSKGCSVLSSVTLVSVIQKWNIEPRYRKHISRSRWSPFCNGCMQWIHAAAEKYFSAPSQPSSTDEVVIKSSYELVLRLNFLLLAVVSKVKLLAPNISQWFITWNWEHQSVWFNVTYHKTHLNSCWITAKSENFEGLSVN